MTVTSPSLEVVSDEVVSDEVGRLPKISWRTGVDQSRGRSGSVGRNQPKSAEISPRLGFGLQPTRRCTQVRCSAQLMRGCAKQGRSPRHLRHRLSALDLACHARTRTARSDTGFHLNSYSISPLSDLSSSAQQIPPDQGGPAVPWTPLCRAPIATHLTSYHE